MLRQTYHDELDRIAHGLVAMTRLAGTAIRDATHSLLQADIHLADSVVTADAELDRHREELDLLSFELLALQQPVATDLRIVVTSMRMSSDIERMGDLARHVAKVTRLRHPGSAVPHRLRPTFAEMGQMAEQIVEKVGAVIAARDVAAARQIAGEDDRMDDLHRRILAEVTGPGWTYGTEAAVDVTLLGRYYERYADHAVSVAERVVWVVTGEWDARLESGHRDGWHAVLR